MIVDKVQVGIIPFGGGVGIRALYVRVNNDSYKDADDLLPVDIAKRMIEEIKVAHPVDFEYALKAQLQFCFVGNGLEDKDNADLVDQLFVLLSQESLELQKSDNKKAHQMRPPFFVWVGKPLVYTGNRQFYEQFNYIIATCPTRLSNGDLLTKENMSQGYSLTALVEIANHNFSQFMFNIGSAEELNVILDVYLANSIPVHGDRIIILPSNIEDKELLNACYDFAEKHRIRLGINYNLVYEKALDFTIV